MDPAVSHDNRTPDRPHQAAAQREIRATVDLPDLSKACLPARHEPAAAQPALLSVQAIDQKIATYGFPEMELLWRKFKTLGIELEAIDPERLSEQRDKHMAPLFGSKAVPLGIAAGAAGFGAFFHETYLTAMKTQLGAAGVPVLAGFWVFNAAFLMAYGATIYPIVSYELPDGVRPGIHVEQAGVSGLV